MRVLKEKCLTNHNSVKIKTKLYATIYDGTYIYISRKLNEKVYIRIGTAELGSIIVVLPLCRIVVDDSKNIESRNYLLRYVRPLRRPIMQASMLYDDDQLFSKHEYIDYIPKIN